MDFKTGRPDNIEDALCKMHRRSWYTWSDLNNRVYANLILTEKVGIAGEIVDNLVTELPSEEEVNAKLKELQDNWDIKYAEYKVNRRKEYPSIGEQLDKIYHDGIDAWKEEMILPVKEKFPKS